MFLEKSPKLVRAPKLSEQIAQVLGDEIMMGNIGAGEKLPSEADLCRRFSVSRTVIREAIGRLEYDGFLEAKQGSRAVVASSGNRRAFRIDQVQPMGMQDMAQLYEFRLMIESSAVTLAARRADPAILTKLRQCIAAMQADEQRDVLGSEANVQFHQLIAEASGNTYLTNFMKFLNEKISYLSLVDGRQIKKEGSEALIHTEHRAICDAIENKDGVRARLTLQQHILNAARRQSIVLSPLW